MDLLKDRRVLAAGGAAVALLAGVAIALTVTSSHKDDPAPPPASQGGLVIDSSGADTDGKMDPAKALRCFVSGQFVGELTLADCAKRNGVATDALDVGLDESGALAAADQAGTTLTPLPPEADATPVDVATPAPVGACWRYQEGRWSKLPLDQTLNACVQTLFAGHCEKPGGATYGRWMQQTLRAVPGRIEVSGDNRSFRALADQQAAGCSISPIG